MKQARLAPDTDKMEATGSLKKTSLAFCFAHKTY